MKRYEVVPLSCEKDLVQVYAKRTDTTMKQAMNAKTDAKLSDKVVDIANKGSER